MRKRDEVVKAFSPVDVKLLSQTQKVVMQKFVTEFLDIATTIEKDVPECADRTVALRKLLECKMLCTQAITHTGYEGVTNEKNNKK